MTNRCDECKFWSEKADEWEAEQAGLRRCTKVRPRWDIADDASEYLKEHQWDSSEAEEAFLLARRNALRAAKAYVQDGSQYTASFWTMPDFFCALWEAK